MKRLIKLLMLTALLCLGTALCAAAEQAECACGARDGEDFEIMRKNMIANDIAGLLPGSIYNQAQGYIDTLQEDGSWKDVDYDTAPSGAYPGMEHVDRLRTIARAYSIPNQPLFESEAAMAAIERALPAIETKMLKLTPGGQRQTPGNWWWWNLNLPFKLGFVLSVAEGKISPQVFGESMISLKWCLSHPLDWYMKGLKGQATNSTDAIKGNLYYAMLSKNEADIQFIVSEFGESLKRVERPYEGITEDGGYVAHNMVDFYGYFSTFILDSIRVLDYLKDTAFLPPQDVTDTFAECLCEGASWAMYQGYRELSASGRSMHGPFTQDQTASIVSGLRFVASQQGRYQNRAQELLDRMDSGYEMHNGQRYFYNGDFTIHKTDTSYVSLRTSSSRTVAGEAWGGNGQTNTFMGDGCMWICNDAKKVYESSALACMDWNRLAGTTILDGRMPFRFLAYYMVAEPFVGGVSDGEYGVSAMNLSHISLPLSAQKSWFFFDDEVVCLGSGIESGAENETHTIVDQRENTGGPLLVDGVADVSGTTAEKTLQDVNWIANDGVGYYFPGGAEVSLKKEKRNGSWSLLSGTQSTVPLTANFTSLYLNHGAAVRDGGYAYAVLPDKEPAAVKDYAEGRNFEILENSRQIHAVRDVSTGSTGVVFWPGGRDCLSAYPASDKKYFDGIVSREVSNNVNRFISVKVKGKSGAASTTAAYGALGFAVSEQRISGDVDIQICWFDDSAAQSGSYWTVKYLAADGVRTTETVPYRYTDQWVTTTLTLKDAAFSGTGLIEDGVELAIVHNSAAVDTTQEKYELLHNPTMDGIAYSTTLYGPIVHSIHMAPHGQAPAAAYRAKAAGIETDTPCIVYRRDNPEGTALSVCDPTQSGQVIRLTVDGRYSEAKKTEGVTCAAENGKTRLTIQTDGGRTYEISLKKR